MFLSILVVNILFFYNTINGLSGDAVCDYIENNLQCTTNPCDCGLLDVDDNCNICDNNNGNNNGCTQCKSDFFNYLSDTKCVECSLIDKCKHCTDNTGCQQCESTNDNPCQLETNRCGIKTCNCLNDATPSPVTPVTPSPTELNLGDKIDGLRKSFDLFWLSRNTSILNDMSNYYDTSINDLICWGGFECSSLTDFFNNFSGLCDGGTISEFNDLVFQDLRVIYSFYRACLNYNNNFGLFFLNGVGITKYNENGEIIEMIVNWRSIGDVLPILQEYKDSVTE